MCGFETNHFGKQKESWKKETIQQWLGLIDNSQEQWKQCQPVRKKQCEDPRKT